MDRQFVTLAFAWICAIIAAAVTGDDVELSPQTCNRCQVG
ncbi:unnamed protein product [Chironomus riparius]|uniref:Uncharacterized protein n=1 Tax=Chironomus riparius TaxID=315576 RepID=A0A9N9RX88_9DIPT|nr:unnamed protein product [Chironomus riparius]